MLAMAKPRPVPPDSCERALSPVEALKQPGQMFAGDAGAKVANVELHTVFDRDRRPL